MVSLMKRRERLVRIARCELTFWCRTIFDPFNYGAPPPPPKSLDDAPTIGLANASWLSQTTFGTLCSPLFLQTMARRNTSICIAAGGRKKGCVAFTDLFLLSPCSSRLDSMAPTPAGSRLQARTHPNRPPEDGSLPRVRSPRRRV